MDLNPLFSSALAKSGKKEVPSQFDKDCAHLLRVLCQNMNWPVSLQKKKWADQFRLMRKEGHVQEKIATVLAAYCLGVEAGKITKPLVKTGEQFRQRFDWIERVVDKLPPPAGNRAKELVRLSSLQYKWPKADPDAVAAFAQRCIAFADDLCRRLALLKKKIDARLTAPKKTDEQKAAATRDRLLLFAANALHVPVANPDSWALAYLKRVQKEVRGWKDWSGDFSMYHPTLISGKTGLKKAVLASGCGEAVWTQLKEELK